MSNVLQFVRPLRVGDMVTVHMSPFIQLQGAIVELTKTDMVVDIGGVRVTAKR